MVVILMTGIYHITHLKLVSYSLISLSIMVSDELYVDNVWNYLFRGLLGWIILFLWQETCLKC